MMARTASEKEIDEMQAGQELDIQITERVLKLRPCDEWTPVLHPEPGHLKNCQHDSCYPRNNPVHYFRNMQAVWELVCELESRGFIIALLDRLGYDILDDDRTISMWRCEFMDEGAHAADRPHGDIWKGASQAGTAELAICRAALKIFVND